MDKRLWFYVAALVLVATPALSCSLANPPSETLVPSSTSVFATTEFPPSDTPSPPLTPTWSPTATPTPGPIGPFLPVDLGDGRPAGAVRDWRVAPDGTLWIATDLELASFSEGAWTIHPQYGDVLLGFDAAGRSWVTSTDGTSIAAWDGTSWSVYDAAAGWSPAGPIDRRGANATVGEEIITDEGGRVWIVTQKDVRVFNGRQWTIYTPVGAGFTPSELMMEEGFDFALRDIALDGAGDVWVSDCAWMGPGPAGQGARWFTGSEWRGQNSRVVSTGCIEDIEVDSLGRIWLGVDGDLWRYAPVEGWQELPHPEHDPDWGYRWGWISDIELGIDDTAWVSMSPCGGASCDSAVFILFAVRDGTWTYVSDEGPADLAFDSKGEGWMCLGNGLYRIVDASPQLVSQFEGSSCRVEADASGRVWLAGAEPFQFWLYEPANH